MGKKAMPVSGCVHHWLIAGPNGPTSPGVCNRCGAEKEFPNSTSSSSRGGWNSNSDIFQRRKILGKPDKSKLSDE